MKWTLGLVTCFLGHLAVVLSDCTLADCPAKTQAYLTQFGYLNPMRECVPDDIKTALIKFQELNYGLKNITVTGTCDLATKQVFNMWRCGCEDIVKFEKKMMPQNIFGPQDYRLGNTKWGKSLLTWKVTKYPVNNRQLSNTAVDGAMRRGLQIWADVTSLEFKMVAKNVPSDINIKFAQGRHTTQPPFYDFDGPGNVLAHAFFPRSGEAHFDDGERFVLGDNSGVELYIVAAHEFGHTLGISHSNINQALMAPYYRYESPLTLHSDDISAAQALYGPPRRQTQPPLTRPPPTRPPHTRPPTTRPPTPPTTARTNKPDYCNLDIKASFKIRGVSYIFTEERVQGRLRSFVYEVHINGIQPETRKPIEEVFRKSSGARWPRSHPWKVDAAAYVPDRRQVFLFRYTRAYRYTYQNGQFTLDRGYPRWMNVREFPERPRAAVAMPYTNHQAYYMLIFGKTMVWHWNVYTQRVGAWAYPIDAYGRNMPHRVDGALLHDSNYVTFFKYDKFYLFSIRDRRVLDMTSRYVKSIQKDFFKKECV